MRVLDLDLDVFVSPIVHVHSAIRPSDADYTVWDAHSVRDFLEVKCGLSNLKPTLGAVFDEHDEIFDFINVQIAHGKMSPPFDLVHVDAHADMGCGQWLPIRYLLTDLMHRNQKDRLSPVRGTNGLNRGTITLFLAAAGWLGSLNYVHHEDDGTDFSELFLDYDIKSGAVYFQVPCCTMTDYQAAIKAIPMPPSQTLISKCSKGTLVPFEVTPISKFGQGGFDVILATRSPGFTPPKADSLFDIIREYINPNF